MPKLFEAYPELGRTIDALCEGATWRVTGASSLLHDERCFYFELTKPKHWTRRPDGKVVVGIGGIGGSLEPGEDVLTCLEREVQEELHAEIAVESAEAACVVYEQRALEPMHLEQRGYPLPALLTVSENLYRRHLHPTFHTLAIVTFMAWLKGEPVLDDLYGLLALPKGALLALFGPTEVALSLVEKMPGVRMVTQEPLPRDSVLSPVWTARSFQLLLQAGYSTKGVAS